MELLPGQFYKKYQSKVVRVFIWKDNPSWESWGGVLIGPSYVLTHGFLEEFGEVHIQMKHNGEEFMFTASRVSYFRDVHLVLFKLDGTEHCDNPAFAEFAYKVEPDQLVYTIGCNFRYSQCRVSFARREFHSINGEEARKLGLSIADNRSLSLIECSVGSSHSYPGDPVFNSFGQLLGIHLFTKDGTSYYVNLTKKVVCFFISNCLNILREPVGRGESSRKRRKIGKQEEEPGC